MNQDKILVIIFGILGIAFTYWFFLMKKASEVAVENLPAGKAGEVDIIVEGGYKPEVIFVPFGKVIKINFIRKDPSSCLEEVVLPDFKIKKFLPLNKKVTVEINPQNSGEFGFACGMNMFHGKILVR